MIKLQILLFASLTLAQAQAGIFSPKPKESYTCRPDRRNSPVEIRIRDLELKNGPSKAEFELWSNGARSFSTKGNVLRTDLDEKKFVVIATQKAQISFDVAGKPNRGTLNLIENGEEEEFEVTCERN